MTTLLVCLGARLKCQLSHQFRVLGRTAGQTQQLSQTFPCVRGDPRLRYHGSSVFYDRDSLRGRNCFHTTPSTSSIVMTPNIQPDRHIYSQSVLRPLPVGLHGSSVYRIDVITRAVWTTIHGFVHLYDGKLLKYLNSLENTCSVIQFTSPQGKQYKVISAYPSSIPCLPVSEMYNSYCHSRGSHSTLILGARGLYGYTKPTSPKSNDMKTMEQCDKPQGPSYTTGVPRAHPKAYGGRESLPMPTVLMMNKTENDAKHECDTCGKFFTTRSNLKVHKRIHTGEKPHKCDVCEKRFHQLNDLLVHKRVHTGEKPYTCDICKKKFARSQDLTKHKRMHTGEKPYRCDVCDKRFTQLYTLRVHQRSHTGEKPYNCQVCGKGFSDLSNLKAHQRTHKLHPKYQCTACGQSFTTKDNLETHQCSLPTQDSPFLCDTCGAQFGTAKDLEVHQSGECGTIPAQSHGGYSHKENMTKQKQGKDSEVLTHSNTAQCPTCGALFVNEKSLEQHKCTNTRTKAYRAKPVPGSLLFLKRSLHENSQQRNVIHSNLGSMSSDSDSQSMVFNNIEESFKEQSITDKQHPKHHEQTTARKGSSCEKSLPHICDTCRKVFTTKSNLTAHQKLHLGLTRPKCRCAVCEKYFSTPGSLRRHQRLVHHQIPSFCCEVCGAQFDSRKDFRKHKAQHLGVLDEALKTTRAAKDKTEYSLVKCHICGKSFSSVSNLEEHQTNHVDDRIHTCSLCESVFSNKKHLEQHMAVHFQDQIFKCEVCGEEFNTFSSLRTHWLEHESYHPYQCVICGKRFKVQSNLLQHRRTHTQDRPFTCDICGKALRSFGALYNHQAVHRARKPYACSVCGKRFSLKFNLQAHMYIHSGEKRYRCDKCDVNFTFQSNYIAHLKLHHPAEIFPCDFCGKVFSTKGNLDAHDCSFSLGCPSVCWTCGVSFKSQEELERHETSVHERPYVHICNVCGEGFDSFNSLTLHQLSHSEDRPFRCELCGKMFSSSVSLQLHKEQRHQATVKDIQNKIHGQSI